MKSGLVLISEINLFVIDKEALSSYSWPDQLRYFCFFVFYCVFHSIPPLKNNTKYLQFMFISCNVSKLKMYAAEKHTVLRCHCF